MNCNKTQKIVYGFLKNNQQSRGVVQQLGVCVSISLTGLYSWNHMVFRTLSGRRRYLQQAQVSADPKQRRLAGSLHGTTSLVSNMAGEVPSPPKHHLKDPYPNKAEQNMPPSRARCAEQVSSKIITCLRLWLHPPHCNYHQNHNSQHHQNKEPKYSTKNSFSFLIFNLNLYDIPCALLIQKYFFVLSSSF